MKRLAWILLAVCCAALVQVQPADGLLTKAKCRSCCDPGACGMPGCCPPATPAPAASAAVPRTLLSRVTSGRRARPARVADGYFLSFLGRLAFRPALVASAEAAPAAPVPLYRAHCSLLI